jgi:transcriptional regulator with XRE-family HTH domain
VWNVADTAGTPRTRALASALRRARTSAGFGVREVANKLDMSHTTISQWETGKRVPCLEDLSAMLTAIGLTGRRRDVILDLARDVPSPNWLTAGIPGLAQQLEGVIECERTATEIIEWGPLQIPGMLQTADYAGAIIGKDDALTKAEVEVRVNLRVNRREATANRENREPADYTALIGEWALRQRVGGKAVLTEQLQHLVVSADEARITVQVVPIGDDWHPGLAGPFMLFNFADTASIVHLEHHRSGVFLYDDGDVKAYKIATAVVGRTALSPADSVTFINSLIKKLEKNP